MVPVSGAYIPIFGAWDSLSYTDTYMMHKHHIHQTIDKKELKRLERRTRHHNTK